MHAMIIGAAGMVCQRLAQRIAKDGSIGGETVEQLTLADVVAADLPVDYQGDANTQIADLSEPGAAEHLVALRPDTIFHLAAIVSGEAEADFDKGYRINLD